MKKVLLIYFLLFIPVIASSQAKYVSDEEFKERIIWLSPNEETLSFDKVIYRVRGYNRQRGGFEVDGVLYNNLPYILSSRVKYIEIPEYTSSTSYISKCNCSLIIKTIVTEKEFNSRKNILHRLNKNKVKKKKKKN